jgi:hypothetical protein
MTTGAKKNLQGAVVTGASIGVGLAAGQDATESYGILLGITIAGVAAAVVSVLVNLIFSTWNGSHSPEEGRPG